MHGTTTGSITCVAIGGEGEGGFAVDAFEGFGGFSIGSAELPQHAKCMEIGAQKEHTQGDTCAYKVMSMHGTTTQRVLSNYHIGCMKGSCIIGLPQATIIHAT